MRVLDDIYFEKGKSEKFFYTFSEIIKVATEAKEKNKANRNLWGKVKHVIGSNDTVLEIKKDLDKIYEEKMKVSKQLEKSRILSDLLKRAKFCCDAADFKNSEFNDFYAKLEKEYKNLCNSYIKESFSNPSKIDNWEPIKQALLVQKDLGTDIQADLQKIDNFSNLKKVLHNIEKTFSALKHKYEPGNLNKVKDDFVKVSSLEMKEGYEYYFRKMYEVIDSNFQNLTNSLKEKIEKEEHRKNPSAKYLIIQMTQYIRIEKDFEGFMNKYRTYVYDEPIDNLKQFVKNFDNKSKIEQNTLERILKQKDAIIRIVEMDNRQKEISSLLDRFILNYKEVASEKIELQKIQKEYKKHIYTNFEKVFSPIKQKLENKLDNLNEFSNWLNTYNQAKKILKQLSNIHYLTKNAKEILKNSYQNVLSSLSSIKLNKSNFSNYQTELKKKQNCYIQLDESYLAIQIQEKLKRLDVLYDEYEFSYNNALGNLNFLKNNLTADYEKLSEKYDKIDDFIIENKNSELLNLGDVRKQFNSLVSEFSPLQNTLSGLLEKAAHKNDLCLLNPQTKDRYLFITKEKIEFGRQKNKDEFYKNGKIFIPWKAVSEDHGYIDLKTFTFYDNSSNGSFSAKSRTKKKQIDLKADKDLNFALQISFDFEFLESFSKFNISYADHNQADCLLFFDSMKDFLDKWTKLYFIIPQENMELFISKIDGKIFDKAEDLINYYKITYHKGKYYFTDLRENVNDELIKKAGNKKIGMLIEKI